MHNWYYTTSSGYSQPSNDVNDGNGALSSWIAQEDLSDYLLSLLKNLLSITASQHNAHYYTWNYMSRIDGDSPLFGGLFNVPACYATGSTTPRDKWTDPIVAFHTKAMKKERIIGSGTDSGYNHLTSFAFRMQEASDEDSAFFNDPITYRAINDFGKSDRPQWWCDLFGGCRDNTFSQLLSIRAYWHLIEGFTDSQTCIDLFGSYWCSELDSFFSVPREWTWGFDEVDWLDDDGNDMDVDALANLLFLCEEDDALVNGGDGVSDTRMYFLSVRDAGWDFLNSENRDLEQVLFEDAMRNLPSANAWNAWKFDSGQWNVEIRFYVDMPFDWDDIDITLFTAELDELENKTGNIGFWADQWNWWDTAGLYKTPTYAIDNLRIRQYCGAKTYDGDGNLIASQCPPAFLEEMDADYGVFSGNASHANLVAQGMATDANDPFMTFYNSHRTFRDHRMDPLYVSPKALIRAETPEALSKMRPGQHPFYYRKNPDGRMTNTIIITGNSLEKVYGLNHEIVVEYAKMFKEMDKMGLLPLTPAKVRYMMSTGRIPR